MSGQLAALRRMALYNRWANARLYGACAELSGEAWRRQRGAFFGSICGTLNHVLVGDLLWLARIEAGASPRIALDTILHEELAALRDAREREDERFPGLMAGLDDDALDREVEYETTSGQRHRNARGMLLQHVFNHQTHHRGQVHNMISEDGRPAPPLDLIYFVRESA